MYAGISRLFCSHVSLSKEVLVRTIPGGALGSREFRYVRTLRVAFLVPLNICKGIYFMNTIWKGVLFDDQRCNFVELVEKIMKMFW